MQQKQENKTSLTHKVKGHQFNIARTKNKAVKERKKYQGNNGDQSIRCRQEIENGSLPFLRFIDLIPPIEPISSVQVFLCNIKTP